MSSLFMKTRSRLLAQGAGAILIGGLLAGCSSDVARFADGTFTPATDNQRNVFGPASNRTAAAANDVEKLRSTAQTAASVQRTSLPPVPTAASYIAPGAPTTVAAAPALPNYSARDVVAPLQPSTPQLPTTTASIPAVPAAPAIPQAPGRGSWTTAGGTHVTMRPGDTLDTLSHRYGVPRDAIMRANGWTDPSQAQTASSVLIPTYVVGGAAPAMPAPAAPAAAPAPQALAPAPQPQASLPPALAPAPAPLAPPVPTRAAAGAGAIHVVEAGETLTGIARRYQVSSADVRTANALSSDLIRVGQRLTIPGAAPQRVAALPSTAAAAVPAKPTMTDAIPGPAAARPKAPVRVVGPDVTGSIPAKPATPTVEAPAVKPPEAPAAPSTEITKDKSTKPVPAVAKVPEPVAPSADPQFRWPVKGRVISQFGKKQNGERADGIAIAVPEGTSVKAAEDGEVIYSGNELKGYGNLVLVRHSNGWVTAYAHNSENLVKRGDRVARGQIISRAGATGDVSQPQLHFEVRKGQRPVDPTPLLQN